MYNIHQKITKKLLIAYFPLLPSLLLSLTHRAILLEATSSQNSCAN